MGSVCKCMVKNERGGRGNRWPTWIGCSTSSNDHVVTGGYSLPLITHCLRERVCDRSVHRTSHTLPIGSEWWDTTCNRMDTPFFLESIRLSVFVTGGGSRIPWEERCCLRLHVSLGRYSRRRRKTCQPTVESKIGWPSLTSPRLISPEASSVIGVITHSPDNA